TAKRNCLPWELGSHQTKITGCEPITIASFAIMNTLATQKNKTSRTTNHVSFVANNCLIKECKMIFLVKKKHVTLHASTQFLLVIG
ncbi:hypothetical protein G9A89_001695, partial [Geosiphon pyriformis]